MTGRSHSGYLRRTRRKGLLLREAGKSLGLGCEHLPLASMPVEGRRLGLAVPPFTHRDKDRIRYAGRPHRVCGRALFGSGRSVAARTSNGNARHKTAANDHKREILNGAAGLLPTGGFLVYVTCLASGENEEQTAGFAGACGIFSDSSNADKESNLGEFFYGVVLRNFDTTHSFADISA